jgi:MGT family glycosyltransferase
MTSHLVCYLFPDFGHLKPTLELTRELVERGHRVSHVTDERYASLVEETGARAVTFRSRRVRLGGEHTVGVDDMGVVGVEYLRETIDSVLPHTAEVFADDVPDAVLYDFESFAVARMLARRWGCPTVQLFPYFASNEKFSPRRAMFDPEHPAIARGQAALFGLFTENGLTFEEVPTFADEYDERNLVFVPRPFQPSGDTFDDRFAFVGPSHLSGGERQVASDGWRPPAEKPVLLASLGTESNEQQEFFRHLGGAFEDGGWHVVLTLGRGGDGAQLGLTGDHFEVHSWLPHPEVLPHTRAFVTHGGMGSILEALHYGVPMLVVPHTPEHWMNAERVTELGLGRTLPPEELTAERLRAAVDELVEDPRVRDGVARASRQSREAGGAVRAADVLEGWLANGR